MSSKTDKDLMWERLTETNKQREWRILASLYRSLCEDYETTAKEEIRKVLGLDEIKDLE